ncbi:putative DEAD helicases superfamily protein [Aulographum hederae CBS 113979]|uniref:Pre-mRNA-splicing factor n=1 Tax=Aulographum hederae CBS 113979 TaxID=1176131 RepID=A0A6G1H1U9_9PEZI|nr:putative DEAD helicases superfamily protein [Aulographum hederae CBS 113979]
MDGPLAKRPRRSLATTDARDQADDSAQSANGAAAEVNKYKIIANKNWVNITKAPKVKNQVIKEELWDSLEKDGFPYSALQQLENLQIVEKYLWPTFSGDASNYHVILLALMTNVKRRENVPSWDYLLERDDDFSLFFRRVLSLSVDTTISVKSRTHLITFIVNSFQSIDVPLVRKECAALVDIHIWHNLHSETAIAEKVEKAPAVKKKWRNTASRYEKEDAAGKARINFNRSWLYTLLQDFVGQTYDVTSPERKDKLLYCERFLELLIDFQGQRPTRRFVNALLQDLNTLPIVVLSPMYSEPDNSLFRDLFDLLRHYTYFPFDDFSGMHVSRTEDRQAHNAALARLQRTAHKHYPQKLRLLALAHHRALDNKKDLVEHVKTLSDVELVRFCELLGFRTKYPQHPEFDQNRELCIEVLAFAYERRANFQDLVRDTPILPTDQSLYDPSLLRNETYNGSQPLAIPKLNLQYLSMGDFLWRSFVLYRSETFYEIRKDVEDVIKRLKPQKQGANTSFQGFSKMALPISKPAIIDVAPARVGEIVPAQIRAEVSLDVSRLNIHIQREWDSLRPGDVVFLMNVRDSENAGSKANGHGSEKSADAIGLRQLRSAEVIQIQDEKGKPLRDQPRMHPDGQPFRVRQRRLILNLDAAAYQQDLDAAQGNDDVYRNINVIFRRRSNENNFRSILESIKRLTLSDIPTPDWLEGVFLGFADPSAANYKRLPNKLKSVDFRDTFLDWQHLVASLPGKIIEPSSDMESSFGPPYVLEMSENQELPPPAKTSKKRRRGEEAAQQVAPVEAMMVSTYKPENNGPYPTDVPKTNTVRFTPSQIEAITSGSQPGLTVIVGPPGTGKTDVATQIINNIYHNFPSQRTLLVAHSNQALNQLFQKIMALDIDERHLLRLGHGEEELETDANYSKHGRVESFLENGARYLARVRRLAESMGVPGDHGSSCETADYFNMAYFKPVWTKYWDMVQSEEMSYEQLAQAFPFHLYFSDAPQPLFPANISRQEGVEIAVGCYRHIEKIFTELEDIRPFELLKNGRDKANYLLVNEARIIAMTSTHAAMRRQEIADLGFQYDNVIMEEAAQITEIENFIPLALQNPKDGQLPLQRVVLCGDHLQNSPIIQNLAFRNYANLEQSLFLRLVRMTVPTVVLDTQGRARPSIADLYRWRYPLLKDLPTVEQQPEFLTANTGFRYEYQFIDVPDYKGKGEMEPTPHFIQNLGEAEYAVAIFMYMRLLGYPGSKISILTTYAGQKALISDVLKHRCKTNRLFGMPRIVTTVDKYQGEQNDYIILSLVRTSRVGYLRDIRRLTVALSRARLGLYVLGRASIFETCFELREAFKLLLGRPQKLHVVTNELWMTNRKIRQLAEHTVIEGVEHLGQYVYEMTQAKVEQLKREPGMLPPALPDAVVEVLDEDEDGDVEMVEGEGEGEGMGEGETDEGLEPVEELDEGE